MVKIFEVEVFIVIAGGSGSFSNSSSFSNSGSITCCRYRRSLTIAIEVRKFRTIDVATLEERIGRFSLTWSVSSLDPLHHFEAFNDET